ncbi:glycosyltransferase [Fluviibacterium sp. S390]|uniref:glycosyltransferase n=1 Tax=Fluviibacterium sp. S390 TaxID=3415139 RepID=UPI003C79C9B8
MTCRQMAAPSLSVVITNFNYGPYLGAAIDSVRAQSLPVDELIVVDDGSGDASREILDRYDDRLIAIRKPNGGQASAFNAGLARTTGEIVVFLDADDVLEPDASALIRASWNPALAALGYRMSLIDETGARIGAYPLWPPSGDMRPDLLSRGQFPFVPTSGNAFNGARLRPFFPLPEARWRISADAVLLRLAAMLGPIRQLDIPLARYRVHGGNGYYRTAEPQQAVLDRAAHDAVDACLATADVLAAAGDKGGATPAAVFELRRAALGLALDARRGGDPRMTLARIGGIARRLSGGSLRLAMVMTLFRATLRTTGGLTVGLADRSGRSALARALAELSQGARMLAARKALYPSRWLVPSASQTRPANHLAARSGYNHFDWTRSDDGMVLHRRAGEISVLPADPPDDGLSIAFDMRALGSAPIEVEIRAGEKRLVVGRIDESGRLKAVLGPAQFGTDGVARLVVSARLAATSWRSRLAAPFRPAALLSVEAVTCAPLIPDVCLPLLCSGETLDVDASLQGMMKEADGTLTLRVARPDPMRRTALELCFGPEQPSGLLTATADDGMVTRAHVTASARVVLEVPPARADRQGPATLALRLTPEEPGDPAELHLTSIRCPYRTPPWPRMLAPGVIHDAADLAEEGGIFTGGWDTTRGVELADFSGMIAFSLPPDIGPSPELEMVVLLPQATDDRQPRLAVTVGAEVVAGVTIAETGVLRIPLDGAVSQGWRRLDVGVHVAGGPVEKPERIRLRILSLTLNTKMPALPRVQTVARHDTPFTLIADAAAALRRSPDLVSDGETVARIDTALQTCTRCGAVLSRPQMLEDLLTIGAARAATDGAGTIPIPVQGAGEEMPRQLARAILQTPPWQALEAGSFLDTLGNPLLSRPEQIARYLTADWHRVESDADLRAYERHVLALAGWVATCFSARPPGSPRYRMAESLLHRLRPLPLLFAGHNMRPVSQAMGRALDAYHLSRDRRITLTGAPVAGPRIRIAALLRQQADVPETRILAGMLGALPSADYEITVYTLEREEEPHPLPPQFRIVPLDWLETDAAMATMRSLQPHIFWLASHFSGPDNLAAICAHRIAPLQIATTAVSPATTGLGSFDVMLGDRETADPDLSGQYTETLVLADHPVQRFAPSEHRPDRTQASPLLRARLGLSGQAVILVSTAHTDKISQALLTAWLKVLAAVPDAVLVLYPFAANWRLGRSRSGFVARVQAACAEQSIPVTRVRIEAPVPAGTIPDLLAGADVFLDSFPYSGATTVVEALQAGTPVISLDRKQTQAGRQGAAWLRAWGLGHLVAQTPDTYCTLAASLAGSQEARAAARAAIHPPRSMDRAIYGAALAATIAGLPGVPRPEQRPRYVFHHMAKAGGTTCRKVFADWFDVVIDERDPWAEEAPGPPVDPAQLDPTQLLWSHFNPASQHLRTRYPALLSDPNFRILTFVRNPLDAALSSYFFECRHRADHDPGFEPMPIDDHLSRAPLHPLMYHLSSIDTDWRRALDRYWFVGTLENMGPCLSWLAQAFGRPAPKDLPWLNRTPRDLQPSPEAVRRFRRQAALDYEIFAAARQRMEAMLASDPCKVMAHHGLQPVNPSGSGGA